MTTLQLVRTDHGTKISVTVTDQTGQPVDLTGWTPVFRWRIGSGAVQEKQMAVEDAKAGRCYVTMAPGDLSEDGPMWCEVRLTSANAQLTSELIRGVVRSEVR